MVKAYEYQIAKQFSRYPGGRLIKHGPFSGELFREEVLLPLLRDNEQLQIDLTGAIGYGASFLDESFGELGKIFGFEACEKRLILICDDDPTLVPMIWNKIKKGAAEKK